MKPADAQRTCILCQRGFCDKHHGTEEGVCEVNHQTYYQRHSHLPNIYPSLTARAAALEALEVLEREKQVCFVLFFNTFAKCHPERQERSA